MSTTNTRRQTNYPDLALQQPQQCREFLSSDFLRAGTKRKNDDQISSVERKIPDLNCEPRSEALSASMRHHTFGGKRHFCHVVLYPIYGDMSRIYTLCRYQTEIKTALTLFVIQRQLASGVNESNNRQKCRSAPTRRNCMRICRHYNAHKHTMIMRNVSMPKIHMKSTFRKFPYDSEYTAIRFAAFCLRAMKF